MPVCYDRQKLAASPVQTPAIKRSSDTSGCTKLTFLSFFSHYMYNENKYSDVLRVLLLKHIQDRKDVLPKH